MKKSVVLNLAIAYAKNLSNKEILEYEAELMKLIEAIKSKRGIK
jgi:hypothetical protein